MAAESWQTVLISILYLRMTAANFTCYTCSYQTPAARDYTCVTSPDQVTTASFVHCPASRTCVTREVYSKALKKITSFNRNCELPPEIGCDPAGDTRVCTYTCTADYCNVQPGGEVEAAVRLLTGSRGRETETRGGGPENTAVSRDHHSWLSALLLALMIVWCS